MKPYYLAATFIGIAAVTLILGAIIVFNSKKPEVNKTYVPQKTANKQQVIPTSSPAPVPLSQQETDKTLTSTDMDIQTTLNQADEDLKEIDNTNTTSDSTNL